MNTNINYKKIYNQNVYFAVSNPLEDTENFVAGEIGSTKISRNQFLYYSDSVNILCDSKSGKIYAGITVYMDNDEGVCGYLDIVLKGNYKSLPPNEYRFEINSSDEIYQAIIDADYIYPIANLTKSFYNLYQGGSCIEKEIKPYKREMLIDNLIGIE